MITSKDIIDTAGISRATLNNYIKAGLLPRPVVGPPPPEEHGAKQIGYFPESVLGRLEQIKALKSQGRSMEEVVALLGRAKAASGTPDGSEDGGVAPAAEAGPARRRTDPPHPVAGAPPRLTIADIASPAYLINTNFEVEWINRQAEELVAGRGVRGIVDADARNIFRLLLERRSRGQVDDWTSLVTLHLFILQARLSDHLLTGIFRGIASHESRLLQDMYRSLPYAPNADGAYHLPITLVRDHAPPKAYQVHTMTFREGTLFVYLPEGEANGDIRRLLARRDLVINDLLRRRMPELATMCVLAADLQDAERISDALLPTRYFELINELWETGRTLFEAHQAVRGTLGRTAMLAYFIDRNSTNYLSNCINCAIQLREKMKELSSRFSEIKDWANPLCLNIGINEGREFLGVIDTGDAKEIAAFGDTVDIASGLAGLARNGEIWAAKSLISRLSQDDRNRFSYGVSDKEGSGRGFVRNSFVRLGDLLHTSNEHYRKLSAIARLPVTEIKGRI
ncbi:MAG: adenylate/guanylate cyclase domain-containing protein [Desulfobulbaceae bacterium]